MKLPSYILKSLQDSKTSLGQHPSYPPDEEDSFIIGTVSDYFNHLSDGIVYNDINELKGNLSSLITKNYAPIRLIVNLTYLMIQLIFL